MTRVIEPLGRFAYTKHSENTTREGAAMKNLMKSLLGPDITANTAMKLFPETKPVFEKYGITAGERGYNCLEPVS